MISNHYATTYNSTYNWLVLLAICLAGALIRVYFVKRHFGKPSTTPLWVAAALLLSVITALKPPGAGTQAAQTKASNAEVFASVQGIMQQRCASCHAAKPTQAGFNAPPQGIVLESAADITKHAAAIYQQTVVSKAMPIANLTKITDEERALLAQWYEAGAKQQ